MRKLWTMLLSLAAILLVACALEAPAQAAEIVDSGTTDGGNVQWTLDSDGVLTFSGDGTTIGTCAFSGCTSLTSVIIPDSITTIGDYAFDNCSGLTSVIVPDSVTTIGERAFSGCSSLTSITIPDSVTAIGSSAFANCSSLTSITISDSVTEIGTATFYGCGSLTSVIIPDGVTEIGRSAFYLCSGLTSVTIPDSVNKIDEYAFEGCWNLKKLYISSLPAWLEIEFVTITSSPLYQAGGAMYIDGVPVSALSIQQNVPDYAFAGCESLTSLSVTGSDIQIGEYAFYRCTDLQTVTLSGVTSLGESAFSECSGLEQAELCEGLFKLGEGVFYKCSSLKWVHFEHGITEIPKNAFFYCSNLQWVDLPNSLVIVGQSAFEGCAGLECIIIPQGVTHIRWNAFDGCRGLLTIWFYGAAPKFESNCFQSVNTSIYYPCQEPSWTEEVRQLYGAKEIRWLGDHRFDGIVCKLCGQQANLWVELTHLGSQYYGGNYLSVYASGKFLQSIEMTVPETTRWEIPYIPCAEYSFHWSGASRSVVSIGRGSNYYVREQDTYYINGSILELPGNADHHYEAVTTAPTCTKDGYTTYSCTVCGGEYVGDTVSATGHSFDDDDVCVVCNQHSEIIIYPEALVDTFEGPEVYGNELLVYEDGNLIKTIEISFWASTERIEYHKDRVYSFQWKKGYNAEYCRFSISLNNNLLFSATTSDCGSFIDGQTVYTMCNHDYEAVTTNPSCTEGGFTTYTCSACGHSYVENVVAKLGHSYAEGICSVCGEKDPDYLIIPTLTLQYPTLAFEDEIFYNVYFAVDDVVGVVEMGLITFEERLIDGTISNAVAVISGYERLENQYMVRSNGISAKKLGDTLYFKVYAKLSDGSYVYSDIAGYHAVAYANTVLGGDYSQDAKALIVAMLNYGAAAQLQFGYRTDCLMNAHLTPEQRALVRDYDASMLDAVIPADINKVGEFTSNNGYLEIRPSVSFEGAFAINFYFTPTQNTSLCGMMYYWDADTYARVD